jgi:hypothetical protein
MFCVREGLFLAYGKEVYFTSLSTHHTTVTGVCWNMKLVAHIQMHQCMS